MMNDTTVVAWDGTPEALSALDWAVTRERPRHGRVLLVRVLQDALLEAISDDETSDEAADALQQLNDQVVRLSRTEPDLEIATQIVRGDPRHRLEAFSSPSNVVVLGTHDPAVREPLFAWSLTARLVSEAKGPLVVVPTGPLSPGAGIVVGVDGSAESAAAVEFAADEAERTRSPLILVHAWLEPVPVTIVGDIAADDLPWLESSHRELLEQVADLLRERRPELIIHTILEQSPTARALDRHARSASLLVVGARGYGPFRGLVLGSVSTALLRTMPCPVAVAGPAYAKAVAESHTRSIPARS
jgi:nucleotide-binding universal stress UspA family protein